MTSITKTKMTYVPPHLRNKSLEQPPQVFAVPKEDDKPKKWVDPKVSHIFKNAKRHKKVTWGWVKLTKNGMVDSMTPDERAHDDEIIQDKRAYDTMISLENRRKKYRDEKYYINGNLSDESVNNYTSEEDINEEYEEEFEPDDEELDLENRMYEDPITKKWNTS